MLSQLAVCLAVLSGDAAAPANAPVAAPKFSVGSRVVVVHETPLRVDDRAVKQLPPGTTLTVEETQDGYLGVTAGRQGWVDENDVVAREKSLGPLSDLVTSDPDNVDLRQARASIAVSQKKWDTALEDYSALLRLEPEEVQHYLDRAGAARCQARLGCRFQRLRRSGAALKRFQRSTHAPRLRLGPKGGSREVHCRF